MIHTSPGFLHSGTLCNSKRKDEKLPISGFLDDIKLNAIEFHLIAKRDPYSEDFSSRASELAQR